MSCSWKKKGIRFAPNLFYFIAIFLALFMLYDCNNICSTHFFGGGGVVRYKKRWTNILATATQLDFYLIKTVFRHCGVNKYFSCISRPIKSSNKSDKIKY